METLIMQIVSFVAPLVAGFITSTIIPLLTKKAVLKIVKKRVEEIDESTQLQSIRRELADIKREILEMRGKIK